MDMIRIHIEEARRISRKQWLGEMGSCKPEVRVEVSTLAGTLGLETEDG